MAELISLSNFSSINLIETTELTADAAAAQAVVAAANVQGFVTNKYFIAGQLGTEQAELRQVSSVASQNITATAAFTFTHKKFESLTVLRGNKIRVYRSANVNGTAPTSGYTLIGTADIEADQMVTLFTDATGGEGYWYKQTYYDSTAGTETDLTDAVAVRGGDFGNYVTIDEVRQEAGFMFNSAITDDLIALHRANAESQVKGTLKAAGYTLPLASVPDTIRNISKLLAAGYLLLQDYGVGYEGTNKDGQAKVDLANAQLKQIRNREIILVDIVESALGLAPSISGWPDDTTVDAADSDSGGDIMFRISKKF